MVEQAIRVGSHDGIKDLVLDRLWHVGGNQVFQRRATEKCLVVERIDAESMQEVRVDCAWQQGGRRERSGTRIVSNGHGWGHCDPATVDDQNVSFGNVIQIDFEIPVVDDELALPIDILPGIDSKQGDPTRILVEGVEDAIVARAEYIFD